MIFLAARKAFIRRLIFSFAPGGLVTLNYIFFQKNSLPICTYLSFFQEIRGDFIELIERTKNMATSLLMVADILLNYFASSAIKQPDVQFRFYRTYVFYFAQITLKYMRFWGKSIVRGSYVVCSSRRRLNWSNISFLMETLGTFNVTVVLFHVALITPFF